jgi:orotate phosphoribosyltransferase
MSAALEQRIAEALLRIGAVGLRPNDPFTWTSGIKSPIYCDNRLTISYPEVRNLIADGFASIIREHYPQTEVIAGIATGGIPHGAWVADRLNLPMIYIRDKAKGHGKQNVIEGLLQPGQKVVCIEDLFSTGGSSLKASTAVREAGAEVIATLSIFTYQFQQCSDSFAEAGIPIASLSNYSTLIDVALQEGRITEGDLASLRMWREDPSAYRAPE